MDVKDKLYTAEEFWDFCQLPENDDKRWELIEGVIVENEYSHFWQSVTSGQLIYHLVSHVDFNHSDMGYVFGPSIGCRLADDLVLSPNVSFVSKTRMPNLEGDMAPAPELAIEVVTTNEDVFRKVQYYLAHDVLEVWAVYYHNKSIFVFTRTAQHEITVKHYNKMDIIKTPILPNFELMIDEIFRDDKHP
jgi:Uma2 family endonuclease